MRQAVSQTRADQTGHFSSLATATKPSVTPRYSRFLLEAALDATSLLEHEWQETFSSLKVAPHTVVYEDLTTNSKQAVSEVLTYLGIEHEPGLLEVTTRLERQADVRSEEWVHRFAREKIRHYRLRIILSLPVICRSQGLREKYLLPPVRRRERRLLDATHRYIEPLRSRLRNRLSR